MNIRSGADVLPGRAQIAQENIAADNPNQPVINIDCAPSGETYLMKTRLIQQLCQHLIQCRLELKANSGRVGQTHIAILNRGVVSEAAEGLENTGV